MDWATVAVLGATFLLGAGVAWYPMSLLLDAKDRTINDLKALAEAANAQLKTEREIDDARDLPPRDELDRLLRPSNDHAGEPPAGGGEG